MTLQACADIVSKGDPDRFAAAMAAPVAARRVLFPLYAFNVEVARAPWVASEPMIGEMRLQWWRDALEEIGEGRTVRRHEVTTPLSEVLDARGAGVLDRLVEARRWDLYSEAFEDEAHFRDYLDRTGGTLMWVAAQNLGAPDAAESVVRRLGRACALARFLAAVPVLEARGRIPLVDGRAEAVAGLARSALADLPGRAEIRAAVPAGARAALLDGWETRACLTGIAQAPGRVADGTTGQSPFAKRLSLLLASFGR
jgi:hypothetical protein